MRAGGNHTSRAGKRRRALQFLCWTPPKTLYAGDLTTGILRLARPIVVPVRQMFNGLIARDVQ